MWSKGLKEDQMGSIYKDEPNGWLVLFALLSIPFTVVLGAGVVADLWGWFVVPLGVPAMSKAQAFGLSLFVAYLTHNTAVKTESKELDALVVLMWAKPISYWCAGYVVHNLMLP